MVDTVAHWFKTLVIWCLIAVAIWWGITHAELIAHVVVTVVHAIVVFVETLVNGVSSAAG